MSSLFPVGCRASTCGFIQSMNESYVRVIGKINVKKNDFIIGYGTLLSSIASPKKHFLCQLSKN